jgi:hypothetical protein
MNFSLVERTSRALVKETAKVQETDRKRQLKSASTGNAKDQESLQVARSIVVLILLNLCKLTQSVIKQLLLMRLWRLMLRVVSNSVKEKLKWHLVLTTSPIQLQQLSFQRIWSDEIVAAYEKSLVLANLVNRMPMTGKKGDTIHIPKPTRGDASAKSAETQVTLIAATESEVQVTIDKHYEYSRLIEDITDVQALLHCVSSTLLTQVMLLQSRLILTCLLWASVWVTTTDLVLTGFTLTLSTWMLLQV